LSWLEHVISNDKVGSSVRIHVAAAPIRARYHRQRGQKVPRRGVFCSYGRK
ncbi:hypothetical protein THAOC_22623, partial [Thalassiosira oceanica]